MFPPYEHRGRAAGPSYIFAILLFLCWSVSPSIGQVLKSSPPQGSLERTAILDAIRLAVRSEVVFKVNHLIILEKFGKAIAFADVNDSSEQTDSGGIFLLSQRNGRWQALASVGGGGGSDDCSSVRPILRSFLIEIQALGVSLGELPPNFTGLLTEALVADAKEQCSTAEVFADRNFAASATVPDPSDGILLHYIDGTQPPDAWLALRSEPGQTGARISQLPNGTLLEVLERRTDNWWRVRVVEMGIQGWVLHKSGTRTWVSCCKRVR